MSVTKCLQRFLFSRLSFCLLYCDVVCYICCSLYCLFPLDFPHVGSVYGWLPCFSCWFGVKHSITVCCHVSIIISLRFYISLCQRFFMNCRYKATCADDFPLQICVSVCVLPCTCVRECVNASGRVRMSRVFVVLF